MESTAVLLVRARAGDAAARDALLGRYLPALYRIAHGRLPRRARGLSETGDLVQVTVMRALRHLDSFEARREGAFLAYLRTILLNQLRDEARRAARTPEHEGLPEECADSDRGPLERMIGRENLELYEAALRRLKESEREAVLLRLEYGFNYEEVAAAIDSPSANAARMTVGRAMLRIAETLRRSHGEPRLRGPLERRSGPRSQEP